MSSILFVYGEGGHASQVKILAPMIKKTKYDFISMSDDNCKYNWSDCHYITGEARSKYSRYDVLFNLGPLKILKTLIEIKRNHRVKCIVSTGPGISIIASLFFKVFGVKVIHVETRARFTTYSLTGRVMYIMADRFYVQNKSLLKLYPKAIYAGTL